MTKENAEKKLESGQSSIICVEKAGPMSSIKIKASREQIQEIKQELIGQLRYISEYKTIENKIITSDEILNIIRDYRATGAIKPQRKGEKNENRI